MGAERERRHENLENRIDISSSDASVSDAIDPFADLGLSMYIQRIEEYIIYQDQGYIRRLVPRYGKGNRLEFNATWYSRRGTNKTPIRVHDEEQRVLERAFKKMHKQTTVSAKKG